MRLRKQLRLLLIPHHSFATYQPKEPDVLKKKEKE